MFLGPHNQSLVLEAIMQDDGYRTDIPLGIAGSTTQAGLTLTASTNPKIATGGGTQPAVVNFTGGTNGPLCGNTTFPGNLAMAMFQNQTTTNGVNLANMSKVHPEVRLYVTCYTTGTTDSPTFSSLLNVYRPPVAAYPTPTGTVPAAAAAAYVWTPTSGNGVAPQAISKNSLATQLIFDWTGLLDDSLATFIQPGDRVQVELTTSAHSTDTVVVTDWFFRIRENIPLTYERFRRGTL